jgi:hypothetical protein
MPRKRKKGVVGRPTRLTIDVAIRLGHSLGRGQSVVKAARFAGVGKTAVYRWLHAGEAGDPRYRELVEARKPVRTEWDDYFGSINFASIMEGPFVRSGTITSRPLWEKLFGGSTE